MAGHNKWSKIKHKKAAEDSKRSKEFSRFSHLITIEAQKANGNVDSPALRGAIDRAKKANMPSANIDKAIKKGFGEGGGTLEEVMYEAYGPEGVALITLGFTDNKNRSSAEIKSALSKRGFSLAAPGAAIWAFSKNEDGELIPQTKVPLTEDGRGKLEDLRDALLDEDSVDEVYSNEEDV